MRADDLYALPDGLPVPEDDGACDHLEGMRLPSVRLPATTGGAVDVSKLGGWVAIYCYPRTGRPDRAPFAENWDSIPGARGCTPQSCAFRDRHDAFAELDCAVFGLSTQSAADQSEAAERLGLPYPVLSDAGLAFARALRLPTFTVASTVLVKRVTLIACDAVIRKVFYPVFPPDRNAADVVAWLRAARG